MKKPRVAIAISTYLRPKTLKLTLKHFGKYLDSKYFNYTLHVQHFYPLKHNGIAAIKNACLRAVRPFKADYTFLFDNDCFPLHTDWVFPFIEGVQTGNQHFCYMKDDTEQHGFYGRKLLSEQEGIQIFRNSAGCCMFFTKEALTAAGAFDEQFRGYGHEHENYSLRINTLGLTPYGPFLMPAKASGYLYSLDIDGVEPYLSQLQGETGINKFGKQILMPTMKYTKMNKYLDMNTLIKPTEQKLHIPL